MPSSPNYKRDYKQEAKTESPLRRKKRAMRNKARRVVAKAGLVKTGDGKDVHHKVMLAKGGSRKDSNTAVLSRKANRGWRSKHPKVYKKGRK